MISLKLNTVRDAEVEQSLLAGYVITQTGVVSGLASDVTSSKLALLDALGRASPACPNIGDVFDPAYPEYICTHRIARGIPGTGGTKAWVWIRYETPEFGGTPLERFAAEDSVTLQAEPTSVYPGTAKQILCGTGSLSPNYSATALRYTDRAMSLNYPRSMRALILYGLFSDRPSIAVANAVNTVNSASWQGMGIARWRCESVRAKYSGLTGMYAITAGFLTKGAGVGDDWSTFAVPINPATGQPEKVDQAALTAEYTKPYVWVGASGTPMSDKNGLLHAGMYAISNFSAIFGDTFDIG